MSASPPLSAENTEPSQKAKRRKARLRALVKTLQLAQVIVILVSISLPVIKSAQRRAKQNVALAQAKGIFYACRQYAADHDGLYPDNTNLDDSADPAAAPDANDANEAFANLIPTYIDSERLFSLSLSRYCQNPAGEYQKVDDKFTGDRREILKTGENAFAYVAGLKDTSDYAYPLIADGFAGPEGLVTNPTYTRNQSEFGGVWQGKTAIVIRCDGSAHADPIDGRTLQVLRTDKPTANLFSADSDPEKPWLNGARVLNPKQLK